VPALLDALRSGPDRFLEHAVIYALIRIADRESTLKGLQDPDPAVRRAAKLSLDAMGDDAGNPKSPAT
jgi:HEAT repeat protein